jgi:hypothetical protein
MVPASYGGSCYEITTQQTIKQAGLFRSVLLSKNTEMFFSPLTIFTNKVFSQCLYSACFFPY